MSHRSVPHLIAYDITNPKRLMKIHKFLRKRAIHMQYSVFYARLTPLQLEHLLEDLTDLMNEKTDDIRIYPLPQKPSWHSLGVSIWTHSAYFGDSAFPTP